MEESIISRNTLIEDLVQKYPQLIRPLRAEGIICLACGEAVWGSLGDQALEKGLDNLDEIVSKMNELIQLTGE